MTYTQAESIEMMDSLNKQAKEHETKLHEIKQLIQSLRTITEYEEVKTISAGKRETVLKTPIDHGTMKPVTSARQHEVFDEVKKLSQKYLKD